jgi:hypothetical protein
VCVCVVCHTSYCVLAQGFESLGKVLRGNHVSMRVRACVRVCVRVCTHSAAHAQRNVVAHIDLTTSQMTDKGATPFAAVRLLCDVSYVCVWAVCLSVCLCVHIALTLSPLPHAHRAC